MMPSKGHSVIAAVVAVALSQSATAGVLSCAKSVMQFMQQRRLAESATFTTRAIGIVTNHAIGQTGPVNDFWRQSRGIDGYNIKNLNSDPRFREICEDIFATTFKIDQAFESAIAEGREKANIANGGDVGLLIDDLPTIEKFAKDKQLDQVKELVYHIIVSHLPEAEKHNTKLIEDYFFKFVMLLHDEATRGLNDEGRKYGFVYGTFPDHFSFFYSDWLGVHEPPEYVGAMKFLQSQLVELKARNPDVKYDQSRFRLGYYHENGAAGLSGIAAEGLFEGDGSGATIGALQAKLATTYKALTQDHYRSPSEKAIFNAIRRLYPVMYAKFVSGSLTLADVMGTESGGVFQGGFFDKLLGDKKLRAAVGISQDTLFFAAIRNEQLFWLDLIRVSNLHRMAAEQVVDLRNWIRGHGA